MASEFHENLVSMLPQLRAYAMTLTRNRAAADDLLQETSLKAWRAQAQFSPGTNFKAWMYCILRNEYISSLRRNKRPTVSVDQVPEEFFSREGDQDSKVMVGEVIKAMDLLNKEQREVLVLTCMNGLSYEEVAQVVGCTIGTVKSRLWRAREHMQKLVMGSEEIDAEAAPLDEVHRTPRKRESAMLHA